MIEGRMELTVGQQSGRLEAGAACPSGWIGPSSAATPAG